MIILFQKQCEGCAGNQSIAKMKQVCSSLGVEFDVRTTLLWDGWADDAKKIEQELHVKQPFFYNTETHKAIESNSLVLLDQLEKLANDA